ncbi:hypothetical protein B0H13DRAFT_2314161 [Mycena leptocephala]|nr:hypothetical protein B0H13DRAFT_2314161 [Mycena leptocephala]
MKRKSGSPPSAGTSDTGAHDAATQECRNKRKKEVLRPAEMRFRLVDDRKHVTEDNKLATLPKSPTVEALLKGPGTQRRSGWRALSAFCAALTADIPAAYYTVILREAQQLTALMLEMGSSRAASPGYLTYPPYPSHSFVLIFGLHPCISVVLCIPRARAPAPEYTSLVTHLCVRLRLSHLSYPQRFTVILRPLCFYDGGERANLTYDKSDPGHFDYKACGNFGEFTTGARSGVMFTVAVFVTKQSTYVGLTADGRRRWDEESMHVWGALLIQLPRWGQGKALAIYDCNVSSVDYGPSLQDTVGWRAVQLARKFKARGGLQVWRDEIPNTAGECYLRTFNWLQSILRSNPDALATFADGELTEIRGFRKMLKPM